MMKKYSNILFDLDGTITDPRVGITKSVAYALNSFGIETANLDDLCKFIGPPLKDSFCEFYGFSETEATQAVEKYREYFSKTGIFENAVYCGVPELLQELNDRGKNVIMATSKPTVFATQILEHFDLMKHFSFVAGSELDGTRTKKGEVIAYALQESKVEDLSSAIMIGDRMHDIIGAKETGIASIGVLFGYGSRRELEQAGAYFIAESVTQIKSVLI